MNGWSPPPAAAPARCAARSARAGRHETAGKPPWSAPDVPAGQFQASRHQCRARLEAAVPSSAGNFRRKTLRKLWKDYDLTEEKWGAYLRYIAKKCRWMLEDRPDTSTGKTWRKKDFDYLITEECYLKVKEERANDLPKVDRVDSSARDAAFISLVAQGRKPKNRTEELAKAAETAQGGIHEGRDDVDMGTGWLMQKQVSD